MIRRRRLAAITAGLLVALALGLGSSPRSDYAIDWWTVDGGGDMFCSGGDFELSGTIGQPDASTMVLAGGDFALTGGFWKPASRALEDRVMTPSASKPLDEDYEEAGEQPLPVP